MIRLEMEFGRIARMNRRNLVGLFACTCLAAPVLAQETTQPARLPPAGSAPAVATPPPATPAAKPETAPASPIETGFIRVTAREVNIRSRADLNSVPVMRIKRGSVLQTAGKEYGWYRIIPPEGTYYYAAARYVERSGEHAGTVRVSTTPLNIRVASQVMNVSPETADVVGQASNGTPVEILGQDGEWLRIKPPAGIYCYINEDLVERVSDAQGVSVIADEPSAARAAPASRPTGEAIKPTTAPALSAEDMSGTFGQQLARVEKDIETEASKPIASQSWDSILARLNHIAAQREEPQIAAAAQAWVPRVERQRATQGTERDRGQVAVRATNEKTLADAELERLRQAREALEGRSDFDALGLLRPAFALATGEYGLRYKLVDPVSQKTRAYVEFPTALGLDLSKINGKYVGIFGERLTRDEFKNIGAPMFSVEKVTVLTAPAESSDDRRDRP